jgi:hypothetical protein
LQFNQGLPKLPQGKADPKKERLPRLNPLGKAKKYPLRIHAIV